ncbi:hypothetical protein BDP55DRAFT_561203 [Colletotrichum godetiae]|uniref:DUF7580 domain-containing protein n=1 Tax=Colletotrichum godetiae TaxID=1209918 RepID=A0AAJ0AC17_9PEZI|nr:uncharacterized protein BDP55DRAFT_561203 [Colletotrichum godetiae]KAK1671148.1 hypothetical protein BDP55DRAFT_561203 [Colletotrichum godetiae]
MAELALGIVGVVPVVGFVLQSCKVVSKTLHDFRHCSAIIKRAQTSFTIQDRIFKNECQVLLRLVCQDLDTIDEMLDDPDHPEWTSKDLDREIIEWLGSNYNAYLYAVKACSEEIERLREHCKEFEVVYAQQQTGERLKATIRRLIKVQKSFKIAINDTEYCRLVENLRESTGALHLLRTQIQDLEEGRTLIRVKKRSPPLGEWAGVLETRRVSQALHRALSEAWNCGQAVHENHRVKLFAEGELDHNEIQLSLTLACRGNTQEPGFSTLAGLVVRSQTLSRSEHPPMLPPAGEEAPTAAKGVRVTQFNETALSVIANDVGLHRTDPHRLSCDLRSTKDFCRELTQGAQPASPKAVAACIGHLDVTTDPGYRHSFFPGLRDIVCRSQAVALSQILNPSTRDSISILDKLKLARSLVLVILRFHSTPWLSDLWRLQDLSIFSQSQGDLSKALETLHVGVGLMQKNTDRQGADFAEGFRVAASYQSTGVGYDQLLCGVDNLSLHSLGVALIQVDKWQMLEVETPDDIVKVRRMSRQGFSLGPQYGEITRNCLRCDFGHGYDLTKAKLQEAVHNNIVGVLEEMIAVLDLSEENDSSF